MKQEDAQRVHFACDSRLGACEHLGRQVCGRPREQRGALAFASSPEVHQDKPAILRPDDVLRLDISMEQARGVNGFDRIAGALPVDGIAVGHAQRNLD